MNLTRFLNEVDNISDSMSKKQLINFVHDIARTLPENKRIFFLDRLAQISDKEAENNVKDCKDNREILEKYENIKNNLEKIEAGEIYLIGSLNEEYDDWYNSDVDEFLFEDPEGVSDIVVEACKFLHQCIDVEEYKIGYDIAQILIDLSIEAGGDYSDYVGEALVIADLEEYHICTLDFKKIVVEAMYVAYWANDLSERAEAMYQILERSERTDITIEMIMQVDEELPEINDFLGIWIQYLGNISSVNAERLIKEAFGLINDEQKLLECVRKYYTQHPALYEQYMLSKLHKDDKELLNIGKEALEKIDEKYIVRSRIALLMSKVALKQGMQQDVEKYWLEAFRSDTRVVNYFRLLMESTDFSDYKNEIELIYHNMYSKAKNYEYIYVPNKDLKENQISQTMVYMLAFFGGEFEYVKEHAMNMRDSLGWSSGFMKCGLAAFLLLLLDDDRLQQGCEVMCHKIVLEVGFDKEEYQEGVQRTIAGNSHEWFWACFYYWKKTIFISAEEKEKYLGWIEKLEAKRVKAIMEGNYRRYYSECAGFIAALGEVREARGEVDGKQKVMMEYKMLYPRRRAFHQELREYGMKEQRKR